MKGAYELATLMLWAIVVTATVIIVKDQTALTYLSPLYAVCAIGSIIIVKKAKKKQV